MIRRIWPLLMLGAVAVRADVTDDLIQAARSPYDLARFIDTHTNFDWEPLWKTLHAQSAHPFLQVCESERDCATELITVVDPLQALLLIENSTYHFQVFLRYRHVDSEHWQFTGAFAPHVKYFRPEHRMFRVGSRPYLAVTEQGAAGTGLSSKIEAWFDLSSPDFRPVLRFTSEGHLEPSPYPVGRTVSGTAVITGTPGQIDVKYSVEFRTLDNDQEVGLGGRADTAVYLRAPTGEFRFDPKRSSTAAAEIDTFYGNLDSEYTDAQFLSFNFEGLKEIASSKDERARRWLRNFLARTPNSPEARELKTLLGPAKR